MGKVHGFVLNPVLKGMMILQRWNLFLISLGCFLLMLGANARTGEYDFPKVVIALILILLGCINFYLLKKKQGNR